MSIEKEFKTEKSHNPLIGIYYKAKREFFKSQLWIEQIKGGFKKSGEFEKTEKDKKIIIKIFKLVNEIIEDLGIEVQKNFENNEKEIFRRIHFLKEEGKIIENNEGEKEEVLAYYDFITNSISAFDSKEKEFLKWFKLTHEIIHMKSYSKIFGFFGSEEVIKGATGYHFVVETNGGNREEKNMGLNEAVTQLITEEIFENNKDFFGFKGNEYNKLVTRKSIYYKDERIHFLDYMEAMSKQLNMPIDELWKEAKRCYFTGEKDFLNKMIEFYNKYH